MSEIIDFYNGKIPLHGKTFNGVCMFNHTQMDYCHDFIQWLFPTVKVSAHHPNAPTLTQEDIETFNNSPILKKKLLYAFDTYLRFLGLEYQVDGDGSVFIGLADNYLERKLCWQTGYNHNFLRITRILSCLRLLGCEQDSDLFYDCLINLMRMNYSGFNRDTLIHWAHAVDLLNSIPTPCPHSIIG